MRAESLFVTRHAALPTLRMDLYLYFHWRYMLQMQEVSKYLDYYVKMLKILLCVFYLLFTDFIYIYTQNVRRQVEREVLRGKMIEKKREKSEKSKKEKTELGILINEP